METSPTVLIVEDERMLGDLFATWLEPEYDVRVAYDGEDALELVDEHVDMAILDRRMPGLSGDEVLEAIRGRGFDFPIAMVTAVDPDFDIVEMEFDDYLVKPIERGALLSLVSDLVSLPTYEEAVQEYFQLASKKAALEAAKTETELASSEEYTELLDQYTQAKHRADTTIETIADDLDFADLDKKTDF
ncbi:response regulator [Halostagnicola sp. A-GB9-2]|uniref:response regulator n=1 Tax=Halostagnicola sp. A-GB9-2 TaxID=3048066 RepID=UPI0024BF6FC3|nr:response regulator [Halostagnicola sp. A-GB9-2]MDJ1433732.1 response regulator [Halostagnicola sp. A-GB9-2]